MLTRAVASRCCTGQTRVRTSAVARFRAQLWFVAYQKWLKLTASEMIVNQLRRV